MEFLVATVIAIIGVLVAYRTLRNQNRGKSVRLHYTSNSIRFVLPEGDTMDELIKVWAGGRALIHPVLVIVRFENTGQAPIVPSDFSGPIRIKFGELALFSAGVLQWNRDDMLDIENDPVSVDRSGLVLKPMLLNPRDRMTLLAIIDGIPDDVKVTTRIAGVEEVAHLPPPNDHVRSSMTVTSLLFELQSQWPDPRLIKAVVLVGMFIVNPNSAFDNIPEVRVAGKRATTPSRLTFMFENVTSHTVDTLNADDPLVFDIGEAHVVHHYVEIDGNVLSSKEAQYVVLARDNQVVIKGVDLKAQQRVVVHVFTGGGSATPTVTAKPSWIDDVTQCMHTMDDFIDENLAKTEPRVLLLDSRLHRYWHRLIPIWRYRFRKIAQSLRRVRKEVAAVLADLRG
ncbi:hypothetical protein [Actinophytocola sp.]|uniref:hypothetical protein n=1 Tax=Actinophytocola sp. TaxID=1872138 RepID=UPI00389AE810